ncbi:hypothetical protein [Tenacibaculum finnmarkense]|uniref:hypothetical protein n=1 Tax=Tenacibaculum finnmarkense TaxID=2781243 RepID=UPI001EFBA961|nr:hypothetical protein [Tenacibaculum finnmarkense]MCG8207853.1 hypothetical protein [Tenacibaculum finnmarkense genomovar finnmarkense]MCG8723915.1 hypothetical protein [Tenacibaculum finnmarkense]MCG8765636.1 hypothetical protein [Tenacibaculum finnmarkense]MCG8778548.1 hypothetical protein [Tenacibaculum finnmarkense]MCM8907039.1 hypothetical protein [Tenacibaculum finnmarkense genomovar finnmarkense]
MKKVYEIEVDDNLFCEWKVVLSDKENKRLDIINKIESDDKIILKGEDKIKFFLINIEPDKKQRTEKSFKSDIIYWTDDITLGAFNASNGVVISQKLKNSLDHYSLHNHYIYPLEIIDAETLETNDNYYLLQILGNINDLTNFKESEYTYTPRRSKEIIKKEKGVFSNYKEYSEEHDKLFFNERIRITITSRIIESKNDVIPGYSNSIFISEDFLKEMNNLTGIIFTEQKDLFIKDIDTNS